MSTGKSTESAENCKIVWINSYYNVSRSWSQFLDKNECVHGDAEQNSKTDNKICVYLYIFNSSFTIHGSTKNKLD